MASLQQSEKGNRPETPRIPEGCRIYALGDIHGRADLLDPLLDLIEKDSEGLAIGRKVLVFLGDYIDRGPDSRAVIERLCAGPLEGFESVFLKGNHEEFLLSFIEGPDGLDGGWMLNGGDATLASYGVEPFVPFIGGSNGENARRDFLRNLPASHRRFLENLRLFHMEGDYLFVHAGLRPGIPIGEQSKEDLLWIRNEFLDGDDDFGKVVVYGHSISARPEIGPNRIGIDTGACWTGRLTCLVLDGATRRFLEISPE